MLSEIPERSGIDGNYRRRKMVSFGLTIKGSGGTMYGETQGA